VRSVEIVRSSLYAGIIIETVCHAIVPSVSSTFRSPGSQTVLYTVVYMQTNSRPYLVRVFSLLTAFLVIAVVGLVWRSLQQTSFAPGSYQAVFLSNNQVYFGKLTNADTAYPILTNVYYIQAFAAQDLSNTTKTSSQLQLVKLGSELHQPQNVMYLNRSQILFIEPLKADSQIVKSITEFESKSQ
jgi:hypothetical protein